jgi:dihydroorotate dehydrogenase
MSGEDAGEKIKAGASLVQFYSGFIYRVRIWSAKWQKHSLT